MIDIFKVEDGEDLVMRDSIAPKGGNVLSIQLGELSYEPDFGVDFRFFMGPEFKFQNSSFRAHLVQRLTEHFVNVVTLAAESRVFEDVLTFTVGDVDSEGLIL